VVQARQMLEATFEIRFSADEACVILGSSGADDVERQAELVCFVHYAAKTIVELGPEGGLQLVHALTRGSAGVDDGGAPNLRTVHGDSSFRGDKAFHAVARFVDARGGPRIFFVANAEGERYEAASVQLLLLSLLQQRAGDTEYVRRLAAAARLTGRLASAGRVQRGSEFEVALVVADVAWGSDRDPVPGLRCPVCGNENSGDGFETRLWPSSRAAIRKCRDCGAGLWLRARRRVRVLSAVSWDSLEALRADLHAEVPATQPVEPGAEGELAEAGALLGELKRVFVENGWPFSEVRGAPVLVSNLSGPLGTWKFSAQVVEELDLILLYSVCPLHVPPHRCAEVSQFLTRANYGLAAGNFELDFEDGEVRYKTVLQIDGDALDPTVLKRSVRSNGLAMETYLPGIGAVITGEPAAAALERRATD
jgi:hypothetical protein